MNKIEINAKLKSVFDSIPLDRKQKSQLTNVFTDIIALAIEGVNLDLSKYLTEDNIPVGTSSKVGGVKSSSTGSTAGRNYNIAINEDGTMKVNVPWTDTTYEAASTTKLGLVKQADTIANVDDAAELSAVITSFNDLLSKLKTCGIIKNS